MSPRGASYTDHIGRRAAENIVHAFDYARYIGRPLNHHVVINLGGVDARLGEATVFERIRHKCRDWLAYKARAAKKRLEGPAYIYTLENESGAHPHAHWVIHIPPSLATEFGEKVLGWVRKVRGDCRPFDVSVQRVDPMTDKSLAKYVVKGTDSRYVNYLHLQRVASPQGRIWGRRATASPAIGRSARKRAGFIPRRDRHARPQLRAAE